MISLVYAVFRAAVHVIDQAKKAALGRLLAESVNSTAPGETLDEKLAALTFPHSEDCKLGGLMRLLTYLNHDTTVPPPSSETEAWWDTPGKLFHS
jgi:synaptojanin